MSYITLQLSFWIQNSVVYFIVLLCNKTSKHSSLLNTYIYKKHFSLKQNWLQFKVLKLLEKLVWCFFIKRII